jgi:tRNA A37 threonylcarbamoyladenosine synthetase subunit TsaC/SUA5/YrdC
MLTISPDEYRDSAARKKVIKRIASVLENDAIIIAPVSQGYAYVSSGKNETAMSLIKQLKDMAQETSLVRLVANFEQVEQLCGALTSEQIRLLEKYWPGPLIAERETSPHLRFSFGSRKLPDTLFFTQAQNPLLAGVCKIIGPLAFSPIMIQDPSNNRRIMQNLDECPLSAAELEPLAIVGDGVWLTAQSTLISLPGADVVLAKAGAIDEEMIREVVPRARVNP